MGVTHTQTHTSHMLSFIWLHMQESPVFGTLVSQTYVTKRHDAINVMDGAPICGYPSAATMIPHMNNATGCFTWIVVGVANNNLRLSVFMEPLDIGRPCCGWKICARVRVPV